LKYSNGINFGSAVLLFTFGHGENKLMYMEIRKEVSAKWFPNGMQTDECYVLEIGANEHEIRVQSLKDLFSLHEFLTTFLNHSGIIPKKNPKSATAPPVARQ
jgi:hypothetical protein